MTPQPADLKGCNLPARWFRYPITGTMRPDMSPGMLFRLFKYVVYALLTANVFIFFAEEHAAAQLQFSSGLALADLIEAYAATIDTGAWVILLLMFELETSVLSDEQFTRPVVAGMHTTRLLCYAFIVYAFYGYIENLSFATAAVAAPDLPDLCSLVSDNWSYAVDLDEYELLTQSNCATMSGAGAFYQFPGMQAIVDGNGLTEIIRLSWVDVINSGVWLLVVLILEIDVRLQERQKLQGLVLKLSNTSKFVLYSLLLLAAIYWGIKGDFVDFWDAFLWLVAFVFIELNIFEWRQEDLAAHAKET